MIEELEDVLNEQFPKGKCKERGNALVTFFAARIKFFINNMRTHNSWACYRAFN